MATDNIAAAVESLTPLEQEAVLQFIDYLKRREESAGSQSALMHAADEFIAQHPDLLERLAR